MNVHSYLATPEKFTSTPMKNLLDNKKFSMVGYIKSKKQKPPE